MGRLSILIKLVTNCALTMFVNGISLSIVFSSKVLTFPGVVPCIPGFGLNTVVSITIVCLMSTTRAVNSAATVISAKLRERVRSERVTNSLNYSNFTSTVSSLFNYPPIASFSRGINLVTVAEIMGHFAVVANTTSVVLTNVLPPVNGFFTSLPSSILNNYAVVVFNAVLASNVRVITGTNFGRHGVAVTTLSLSVNVKFAATDRVNI